MPRAPMTESEIQEVKQQILDIAFRIVYEEGFSGLSMRKIAKQIGMTAANIYNYFSNKDELNIEMRKFGYIVLYDKLDIAYNKGNDINDKIRLLIKEFISFGLNSAPYYELMFNMPTPKYSDYVGTPMEELATNELRSSLRLLEIFNKVILEFVEDGGIVLTDNNTNVIIILSYLHGLITLYNNKMLIYINANPEATVEFLTNFIIEVIYRLKDNKDIKDFFYSLEKM